MNVNVVTFFVILFGTVRLQMKVCTKHSVVYPKETNLKQNYKYRTESKHLYSIC